MTRNRPPASINIVNWLILSWFFEMCIRDSLETLERNGYIRRDPTKPRAIEILDDEFALTRREMVQVPVIGTVAAGQPILAQENIEDYFPIPASILPNAETFMLRVKGESMINIGIFDGDQVIVCLLYTSRCV